MLELNFIAMGLYMVAALGGLIMAVRAFKGFGSPALLAVLHFLFAGAASATLGLFIFSGEGEKDFLFTVALGLYVVAALGGLFLASFRFRGSLPPNGIIVVHAVVAVCGTGALLAASFS